MVFFSDSQGNLRKKSHTSDSSKICVKNSGIKDDLIQKKTPRKQKKSYMPQKKIGSSKKIALLSELSSGFIRSKKETVEIRKCTVKYCQIQKKYLFTGLFFIFIFF